jgi:hypothetical protein
MTRNYPKDIFEQFDIELCQAEHAIRQLQKGGGGYFPIYKKAHLPSNLVEGEGFMVEEGQFCVRYGNSIYCMPSLDGADGGGGIGVVNGHNNARINLRWMNNQDPPYSDPSGVNLSYLPTFEPGTGPGYWAAENIFTGQMGTDAEVMVLLAPQPDGNQGICEISIEGTVYSDADNLSPPDSEGHRHPIILATLMFSRYPDPIEEIFHAYMTSGSTMSLSFKRTIDFNSGSIGFVLPTWTPWSESTTLTTLTGNVTFRRVG